MDIKHSGFILFLKSDSRQFLQQSVLHGFCRSGESNMPLNASADQKGQNKCAHVRPFQKSTTPCMLPWKKRGVDGRGMVKVRKKMSWKQTLSVSLPKDHPGSKQPCHPQPAKCRERLWCGLWSLGRTLGHWESRTGSAGEEYFYQLFAFLCKGPVTAEIITFSCWTPPELHSDKNLDDQKKWSWDGNISSTALRESTAL